ncbi:hypothetical protein [Nostoc sp.]|uniref:hypothetical protein n=1 Tax=Nostoc sp. TaxID=1180 RepID=UPI002FF5C94E
MAIAITADKKRGIRIFFWTYNADQLIYMQDSNGDENFHLHLVNIHSKIVRDLTPFQGAKAELVELEPKFPDQMLVALNLNNPQKFDVYRINLKEESSPVVPQSTGRLDKAQHILHVPEQHL